MTGTLDLGCSTGPDHTERPVSRLDAVAARCAALGVGLLIVTGFASSYTTLRDLAVEVGGFSPWLAPVVPLSFDLGIVVLSLKVVLAARAGRDARVLRVLVLLLSAATVVANGAASTTAVGRLLHAVPPAMFVICFETLAASARHTAAGRARALAETASAGAVLPVLTAARWFLAPRQTWTIWRSRVLGVVESSPVDPLPVTIPRASAPPAAPRSPSSVEPAVRGALAVAGGGSLVEPVGGSSATAQAIQPSASTGLSSADGPPPAVGTGLPNHRDRLAVAVEALQGDPVMTAVVLADHLHDAGHPVSARTAQRVRHQAQEHLGAGAQRNPAVPASPRREGPA